MAAGINDKFKETFNSANPNVTFVSTQRSGGATTLICDSLTGWPTDTAVDFITYQLDTDGETVVPGSQRDWKGIVSTNTITNLTLIAGGADAGNQVNDIVEMTPTANWANDLVTGILVSHDQDGTLKDDIVTTAKIDDEAVTTAKIDDGAVTNAKLSSATGEPGGAWESWTPSFTNLSGGTLNFSKFKRVGNSIFYRIKYTLGGAGVAGGITFTLPVTPNSEYTAHADGRSPIGNVILRDSSAGVNIKGEAYISGTSANVQVSPINTSSTYASYSALSSTEPFTWASSDTINISGNYEA